MTGKGQITSERASSQKIIRLQDADNENKMAGKGQITNKRVSSQKVIRLQDADKEEDTIAGKGQITSKRASSQKIIRLQDADNENKMAKKGQIMIRTSSQKVIGLGHPWSTTLSSLVGRFPQTLHISIYRYTIIYENGG